MSHYHQTPFTKQDHHLSLDALYCEEEQWDDLKTEDFFSFEAINHSPPLLMQEDLFWEDEELINMLSKEQENELCSTLLENPSMAKSRHDAIEWMLEVVGYYSFSALTASLAVNYFDRFLFCFKYYSEKPWMIQLTAVSCLSLAAKVEETHVPLLLDFQVKECKFVFEAKTIRRMEILVLSTLQWKMNPVTPLSFIDFIIRRLGLMDRLSWEFLNKCERLLLAVISDCRFTVYLPSEMATATMLEVISNLKPSTLLEFQEQLLAILGIDKGQVEECCRLIKEVASTIHWNSSSKRRLASLPKSPKGVMDVSFSSESSNESWAVASSSVTSSPHALPPQLKKCRKYV
ncbi:kinase activator [Lithospermum erythrorhizon]|uniref:Kinase activator n=1 Tax=Lithospermum erythrorhizon TaxID=34254 RepID=A0AAV3QDE5_LITER